MGELTFKSAGVKTREIDLSQPSRSGPIGVPAGIIGTSQKGPAYVPLTFSNYKDFKTTFGASNGERFGPMAVNQWLANAQAVTFIRVLGAGNGEQRTISGKVTNAGFTVGEQTIQSDGELGNNPYAVNSDSTKGRTYFLGCFMSESNGSTSFTDAGIQTGETATAILRGVILAPSGVILHLSGNSAASNEAPSKSDGALKNPKGDITGSLNLASQEFVMLMNGYSNSDSSKKTAITASFDMTSPNYFANIFNKDPLKIEEEGHLLYGHYDIYPDIAAVTGSGVVIPGQYSAGTTDKEDIAMLLPSSLDRNVGSSDVPNYEDFEDRFTHAKTPYVISQAFGAVNKDLFRIHLLSDGETGSDKLKFSIENIRKSSSTVDKYGTFDLVVRKLEDTDTEPLVLESFRGLSLDPSSDRYIGRVIGDQHIYYNFDANLASQKIVVRGSYPVNSRFIRVELHSDVESGNIDAEALPFGYRGYGHTVTRGSILAAASDAGYYSDTSAVQGIVEPPVPYRENISIGSGIQKRVDNRLYWGLQSTRKTSASEPNLQSLYDASLDTFTKHFPSHRTDVLNFFVENNPGTPDVNGSVLDCDLFNNNKFSLENVLVYTGSDGLADQEKWADASYVRNGVIIPDDAEKTRRFKPDDLKKTSNIKFAKFTFMAQGGFNGNNIFNEEKYKMENPAVEREMLEDSGVKSNTIASFRKAVDVMSSKTDVDVQLLATPGIRHPSVTDYAIQKIENRFDAMYIMDIEEKDEYSNSITSSTQKPHVANTVLNFTNRGLDTSFAAAYFPDVVITDPDTKTLVQVPPSVAVLGAYSLNDSVAHPWYAPAGFTRGALSTVEMASVRLNRTNLDDLYEADINPIAQFPGSGITIWGQKTLLAANSALDRINVRRLLIDVRRKVKAVANTLLFEPNREETLERFSALVNPILQRVQEQSGVERYKAVIDTSTTTQADVENNTIRGKIYLQPTRSVEFIALDFVVTNAGSNI